MATKNPKNVCNKNKFCLISSHSSFELVHEFVCLHSVYSGIIGRVRLNGVWPLCKVCWRMRKANFIDIKKKSMRKCLILTNSSPSCWSLLITGRAPSSWFDNVLDKYFWHAWQRVYCFYLSHPETFLCTRSQLLPFFSTDIAVAINKWLAKKSRLQIKILCLSVVFKRD